MRRRRADRWIAGGCVAAGLVLIAFSVQIRTWHGRGSWAGDPRNQVFVTSWLASEMWVNPAVLAAGGLLLLTGIVYAGSVALRTSRRRRSAALP